MPCSSDEEELQWLIDVDVPVCLSHLKELLATCSKGIINTPKQCYLYYCSPNQADVIKVNATLEGFRITNADINIKLSSRGSLQTIKTCIKETPSNPFCWRLHQVQDAINYLSYAIDLLNSYSPESQQFKVHEKISQLVDDIMNLLVRCKSSLMISKKRTIEDLQQSQNMQSIRPSLPIDYSISFYVQGQNLVCSVYQLMPSNNGAQVKAEYQAELAIQPLGDFLISLGLGMQACQQIRDKLQSFTTSLPAQQV